MCRGLIRRNGDDRHLQPASNCRGDLASSHTFFSHRMVTRTCGTFLECQTIEVAHQNVNRGPAIEAFADVCRGVLFCEPPDAYK